ncbi:uncharacterized protein DUF2490 [Arcicella aurantiaca]|uniref:Uncharacterized protein DUF2490 n=1 Tax=Arcicella aurantiaca TaxID=591202 RepID=A0A316DFZ1_9BACT|nr:DUF2490 domain-containing protein [Arcicella aurantiaca]PWK17024.1 uncharacterized protein DUF2490 [Arcicella aurantiaca]
MKYHCLIFTFLFSCQLFGQANITNQNLYWTRYYNQLSLNSKWTWHNEIDMRRFADNSRLHHLIIHSHLHYKVAPNFDVAAGITYSQQSPQFSDATSTLVVPEIRPFQEINQSQTLGKRVTLSHRFRLDERFIRKNNGTDLLEGSDFNFRFRYRPQLVINLSKSDNKTPVNLKVADELMLNFGGEILYNHFDQNRVYAGFEKVLSKNFSVEMGYLHWFQQRNTGKDFFDRNIVRLTILHKVKL